MPIKGVLLILIIAAAYGIGFHKQIYLAREGATTLLEDIPAADVAPVVHGEWLLKHKGYGHYWLCSVCNTNPCIYVTENTKFCPNCGAKMDGGKHETD